MAIHPRSSNIHVTVTFDRPVSGLDLIQTMRKLSADQGTRFVPETGYMDGYGEVGSVERAGRRIQLSPTADQTYFDPRATYQQAVAIDASDVQETRHPAIEGRVNAVRGFAQSLQQVVNQHAPDAALQKATGLLQDQSSGIKSPQPGLAGQRDLTAGRPGQQRDHGAHLG